MDKIILDYFAVVFKQRINTQFDLPLSKLINFKNNSFKISIENYELIGIDNKLEFKISSFPFKNNKMMNWMKI